MIELWLDERILGGGDLDVVNDLVAFVDLANTRPDCFSFLIGSFLASNQTFTQWLNRLPIGRRLLLAPIIFRIFSVVVNVQNDWRYKVDDEAEILGNSSPAEIYESIGNEDQKVLVGWNNSSYSGKSLIQIRRLSQPGAARDAFSICSTKQLREFGTRNGIFPLVYDLCSRVPPTDEETILGQNPNRFLKVKPQRHGRRMVYREIGTGRMYYVDNLHFGTAAHLEVFSTLEVHLGEADLMGNLKEGTAKDNRVMHW